MSGDSIDDQVDEIVDIAREWSDSEKRALDVWDVESWGGRTPLPSDVIIVIGATDDRRFFPGRSLRRLSEAFAAENFHVHPASDGSGLDYLWVRARKRPPSAWRRFLRALHLR